MPSNNSRMLIDDGIMLWFDGPEWDVIAEAAFEEAKDDIVSEAQRNAPWADRTGDAREGLEATVKNEKGEVVLYLYHTVEYGLWLEVIQSGRFATIMPTLERMGPTLMKRAEAEIANARSGR